MEPRIQYAKTSDGVDMAFHMLGQGLPLVASQTCRGATCSLSGWLEDRQWIARRV